MNEDADARSATREESASHAPPEWFVEQANVSDPEIRSDFEADWPECWSAAADLLSWESP